jgi:RNase P subunit RPR2
MSNHDSAPYASCDHCGWHGRYEQLTHRAEGDLAARSVDRAAPFGTADETREEIHRMRRAAHIGTMHALAERAVRGSAEDARQALEDILTITHLVVKF